MSIVNDPYQLRPEDVIEPPKTFFDTLKRIGPGMILAASIVGSGELIATTTPRRGRVTATFSSYC